MTGERTHDAQVWTIGPWVRGRLLLFDLGFFWYALFARIVQHGGFFISRLKEGSNPRIVAVHQGDGTQLLGQPLQTALLFIRRPILDVQVEVTYKKRAYEPTAHRHPMLAGTSPRPFNPAHPSLLRRFVVDQETGNRLTVFI